MTIPAVIAVGEAEIPSAKHLQDDLEHGLAMFRAMSDRMDQTDAHLLFGEDGRYVMIRLSPENVIPVHSIAGQSKALVINLIQGLLLRQFGMASYRTTPVCEAK